MNRQTKEIIIKDIETKFTNAKSSIFAEFRGLNVKKMEELRKCSREKEVEFQVVKNTLAQRAYSGLDLEAQEELFIGPTAVAFGWGDPIVPIKVLTEFAKENPELIIKGGIVEGKIIRKEKVSKLAELPSREVLLSQFLMGLQSPIGNMMNVLSAPMRGLLNCLRAIEQKKS